MKIILVLSSIIIPIVMIALQWKWFKFQIIFDIIALFAALIFGNIASIAIYHIIKDNTVFMTNIHGLFLKPFFLLTGAYLGVYLLYSLVLRIIKNYNPV